MRPYVLMLLSTLACGGTSADSERRAAGGLHACDPLAGDAEAITRGPVIAGGRTADGTVYLVDRGPPRVGYRVFIGPVGGPLRRHKVAGSGDGPDFVTLMVGEASSDLQVRVDLANGAATRMSVFRGAPDPRSKSFDPTTEGEVLTLVSSAELETLPLQNLPAEVVVEYDAETADGRRLVVLRPANDWTYEDFRVFFGAPTAMMERKLANASRGSSTYLTFDLDGRAHDAFFPSSLSGPTTGGARLTPTGEQPQPLTVRASNSPPTGLTFQCL